MDRTIMPSRIKGTVEAPSSKSYFQRAIAAGLLAKGTSRIFYHSHCNDSISALHVVRQLGAHINDTGSCIDISGGINPIRNPIDCGESGLILRMFSALAALQQQTIKLTGTGSLARRDHSLIVETFEQLGVQVKSNNGRLPLEITGALKGGNYTVDGSKSSQHITGLLMALPLVNKDSLLKIEDLKSRKYIEMTLELLDKFGIEINRKAGDVFEIPGNQNYKPVSYTVEGDWSAAAFWIVAALINGDIRISNLNPQSLQADADILKLMDQLSLNFSWDHFTLNVLHTKIPAFTFDATDCPDLFPPLVAMACYADGVCTIRGVHRLYNKESNRAKVLQQEFGKLGIKIVLEENSMHIHPGKIRSATATAHNDHRIAMALAVATLGGNSPITIQGIESVNKSYPAFFNVLDKLCVD